MLSTLLLLPTPCFLLPALRKWQFGWFLFVFLFLCLFLFVLAFCIFWSRICPNCTCTLLFLVPYSFFVFRSSRRGVSRCKHCSTAAKGPRSRACLRLMSPASRPQPWSRAGPSAGWCPRRGRRRSISMAAPTAPPPWCTNT